jgi:parallel beta-helix repeat protein
MLILLLTSMFILAFNVQPVNASATVYIRADGSIDPSTAPISSIDNVTYTFTSNINDSIVVERNNTVVDGAGYTVQGTWFTIGIDLSGRNNITIKNVEIKSFMIGIRLSQSSGNRIFGNNITANDECGIYFYQGSSNSISGNNITANNGFGIRLDYSSGNNTIFGNNITANNVFGIKLYFSSGNSIFHNNFINNAQQVYSTDSANVWDNGYPYDGNGGNYWSDYAGVDLLNGCYQNITGSDGIGDAPYIIDANNQDNYPLMNPWPPAPSSPGYYETSEYLIGSVAVGVVFLESNGSIDTKTENWNSTEESQVVSKIQVALNWWSIQNPSANVSFVLTLNYRVPTSYEPINRPAHADEYLWIGEAMTNLGYPPRPGTDPRVEYNWQTSSYVNSLRDSFGTDWAFVIFVVDSSNDADGAFTDNSFAYAYLGGPLLVMTYDNKGWGIARMGNVTAHEMGHIFYATDEYNDIPDYSGYLNVLDIDNSGALMDVSVLESGLSNGTRGQIGWRDTDGDGIQDIVDTFPDTILNSYSPDPTNKSTLTYTGTVTEIPYPNNNPYGTGRDVTINTITNVEFRVDGGAWINATSDDGSFDEFEESFSFTTPPLSPGTHIIKVRGINSVGNIETTYASDEVTIYGSDIAVTSVAPSKTVVGQGFSDSINVTVANQGSYTETFNVTIYANTTSINTFTNVSLLSGNSVTLTFTWNTSGFVKGNYTIKAIADTVPGETDIGDNRKEDGCVIVTYVGDFNGDFIVNYKDDRIFGWAYIAYGQTGEVDLRCDLNEDGKIDYKDDRIFGWAYIAYGRG